MKNYADKIADFSSLPQPQQQQVHVLQLQQHPTAATKSCPNDFLLNFVIFIINHFKLTY